MKSANKILKIQVAKVYNPFTETPITKKEVVIDIINIRKKNYRYVHKPLKKGHFTMKRLICGVTRNRKISDNTREPNLFSKSNQYKMV